MEPAKHDKVMTSFPSEERVDEALGGLESRLRLAATGSESYNAAAVAAHQLFELTSARLGIVEPAAGGRGATAAPANTIWATCHEMTECGVASTSESVDLASTAYEQVVTNGCADYEPLSSSLVLPIQIDGAASFLHLMKSGVDSFAFDEFEIADRLVNVLSRELHAFKRRPNVMSLGADERSPLGATAPDTIGDLRWGSDVVVS